MVAIVSGNGLGLYNSSLNLLGSGTGGQAGLGRLGEQLYVNSTTGNLIIQQQDEYIPAQGLDLSVLRTYNSQGTIDGDNNDSWRIGVYRSLYNLVGTINAANSTITKVYGDGHETVFTYNTTLGAYRSTDGDGAHDTLSYNAGTGQWTYTDGSNRDTETYNSAGQLTGVADRDGTATTYTYSGSLITQISQTGSTGVVQTLNLDYNASNQLTQVRALNNGVTQTRVRYSYDTNRLSQVSVDLSPTDNVTADGRVYTTTYTYDGSSTRIASITQGDGTRMSFTYVPVGATYKVDTMTDGLGRITRFSYVSATQTDVTDPLGLVTSYINDASNRLVEIRGPAVNGVRPSTFYEYDADSNLTKVTDPQGNAVVYQYDNGNPTLVRDAAGNTITRTYSTTNQLLTETVYLTPDPDGTGALLPSAPQTTRYAYDGENHLRFVITAEGRVSEYQYNAPGKRTASIQYLGGTYSVSGLSPTTALSEAQLITWVGLQDKTQTQRTKYSYEFHGLVQGTTVYAKVDASGAGVADGSESSTTEWHQNNGDHWLRFEANGGVTYEYFDGLGRRTMAGRSSGGVDQVTQIAYDDANNRIVTTQADGLVVTAVYNAAGELVSRIEGSATANLSTTTYTYDANGRLRHSTDSLGQRSYYLYDEAGRQILGIDATGALTEKVYNKNGQVAKTIAYATRITSAQLATLVNADGTPATLSTVAINALRTAADTATERRVTYRIYDAANRLAYQVDEEGYVTQTQYDGASRITAVIRYNTPVTTTTWPATPTLANITVTQDANYDRRTRMFYDADGRLLGTLDAEGYLSENQFNAGAQLTATVRYARATEVVGNMAATTTLRTTGTFSDLKQNITAAGANAADQTTRHFYNGKGLQIALLDAEGYLTEYSYDLSGNRTEAKRWANRANAYSAGITIAALRPAASLPTDPAQDQVSRYTYDAANRLGSETDPAGTVTVYQYDQGDRVVKVTRGLEVVTDPSGITQTYMEGTQRVGVVANGQLTTYDYDANNKLVRERLHASLVQAATWSQDFTVNSNGLTTLTSPYFLRSGNRLQVSTQNVATTTDVSVTGSASYAMSQNMVFRAEVTTSSSSTGRYLAVGAQGSTSTKQLTALFDGDKLYAAYYDASNVYRTTLLSTATNSLKDNTAYVVEVVTNASSVTLYVYERGKDASTGVSYSLYNASSWGNAKFLLQTRGSAGRTANTTYVDNLSAATVRGRLLPGGLIAPEVSGDTTKTYVYAQDGYTILGRTLSDSRVTSYRYDLQGRLVAELTGKGNVYLDGLLATNSAPTQAQIDSNWTNYGVKHSYDAAGRRTSTTDQLGHTTYFYYDENSQLRYAVTPADNDADLINQGEVAEVQYNAFGEAKFTRRFSGRISTVGLTGGLINQDFTDRLGTIVNPATDATTTTNYSLRGAIKQILDAESKATTYTYNAFNERYTESTTLDASKTLNTYYGYDRRGLLLNSTQIGFIQGAFSQYRTGTARQYDAFGRVTSEMDSRNNQRRFTYDRLGRTVTVTDPLNHSQTSTYDAFGRVLTQTDALNHTTRYEYNDAARTLKITTPEGVSTTTTRNRHGETVSVSDGRNNTATFLYSKNGKLLRQTNAAGEATVYLYDNADRMFVTYDAAFRFTSYTYDAANRVLTRTSGADLALITSYRYDALGRTATVIDPNGVATQTVYDRKGQVTTVTVDPTSYVNAQGVTVSNPSGLNLVTTYSYDDVGHTLSVTEGSGTSDARTTQYQYDTLGRRIREIVDPGTGHLNLTTAYSYDQNNNVVARTEGLGTAEVRTSRYVYDANNRQTYQVDATGAVVKTDYDNEGRVLRTTAYANSLNTTAVLVAAGYTAASIAAMTADQLRTALNSVLTESTIGAGLTASASTDRITWHAFDRDGREVYSLDAAGVLRERQFDGADNVTQVTVFAEPLVAATIAALSIAQPDGNKSLLEIHAAGRRTNADNRVSRTVYDSADRAVFQIDGLNNVTEARYDGSGNLISTTAYARAITLPASLTAATLRTAVDAIANAATDHTTRTVYDAANRARYTIDTLGYVTETQYDNVGRIKQTTAHYTAVNTATLPSFLGEYEVGQALAARANPQTAKDQVTRYDYDRAGRLTTVTQAATTPDQYTESYAYDAVGQTLHHTNGRGHSEYFAYDVAGRVKRHIDYTGYVVDSSYNALGQRTAQTTYMSAVALPTTANDRYAYTAPNPTPNTDPVSGDRTVTYTYDLAGRLKTQTAPSLNGQPGVVTRYLYNSFGNPTDTIEAEGRPEQRTTRSVYNSLGQLTEQTTAYGAPEAATTRFGYDAFGNQKTYIDPRGVELAETNTDWAKAERLRLGYTVGSGTTLRAKLVSELTSNEQTALRTLYTTTQDFDRLNRKTAVTDALGNKTQTQYDAFGNIVKVTDPKNSVGYFYFDARNRVTFQVDPEGYATQTVYDATGNATETVKYANKVQGSYSETTRIPIVTTAPASGPYLLIDSAHDQHTRAEYDVLNRTSKITDAEGYFETFRYDAQGNVKVHVDKNLHTFTYDYDAKGNKIAEYLPIISDNGAGVPVPVINRYEYDAVGNKTKSIEAAGLPEQRVTQYRYDKNNRLIGTVGPTVAVYNAVTHISAPVAITTAKTYDARGNLVTDTDANGNVTYYYYDANDRRIATVNAERYLHTTQYNTAGNLVAERTYADRVPVGANLATLPNPATLAGMNPANYRETKYRYNANNLRVESATQEVLAYVSTFDVTNPRHDATAAGHMQSLVVTQAYDANGNMVKVTDANGNNAYNYYDKAGHKILTVDPLGYVTAWTYDGNGNIVREAHYATALQAATRAGVSVASNPVTLAAEVAGANNSDDRITRYVYDRMNRKTQAVVENLAFTGIDTAGALTPQSASVATRYEYDGLGNLTAVIAPDGGRTDYTYDALSRMTREQGATFTDFQGASVRTSTTTVYDGVNDARQVINEGKLPADNEVHQYFYDAAGRRIREIDAENAVITYDNDANGNVRIKHETRTDADNNATLIATEYQYDSLNRQAHQIDATGVRHDVTYNAFGEIAYKGINGNNQEVFVYDKAGRLVQTNKDDGVWRAYLYDANGNETAKIQPAMQNVDLNPFSSSRTPYTLTEIAALDPTTVQRTESVYDARNQLSKTYQASIDTNTKVVSVTPLWVDITDPFQAGSVIVGGGQNLTWAVNGPSVTINGFGYYTIATSAPIAGYPDAITTYRRGSDGQILLQTINGYIEVKGAIALPNHNIITPGVVAISGPPQGTESIALWLWRSGEAKSVNPITLSKLTTITGTPIDGYFMLPQVASGDYQYEYKSLDANKWELDHIQGSLTINTGPGWQVEEASTTQTNCIFMDSSGNEHQLLYQNDSNGGYSLVDYVQSGIDWHMAQALPIASASTGTVADLEVSHSGNGTAMAAWRLLEGDQYNLYASRYIPGAGWQTATPIATNVADFYHHPVSNSWPADVWPYHDPNLQVAIDGNGNAFVAWVEYSPSQGVESVQRSVSRVVIKTRIFSPTNGWQSPTVQYDSAGGSNIGVGIALKVSASGYAVLFTKMYGSSAYGVQTGMIRYVPGSGWQSVENPPVDAFSGSNSYSYEYAMGEDGTVWYSRAWTFWESYNNYWTTTYTTTKKEGTVEVNRYVPGTGWTGFVQIGSASPPGLAGYKYGPGSDNVRLYAAGNGNLVAVWEKGGTWVTGSPGGSTTQYITDRLVANYYTAAAGWGGETNIDPGPAGLVPPGGGTPPTYSIAVSTSVAMDANGNVIVTWMSASSADSSMMINGTTGDIRRYDLNRGKWDAWARRYIVGAGWEAPTSGLWSTLKLADEARNPIAVMDQNGNVVVKYVKTTSVGTAWSYVDPNTGRTVNLYGNGVLLDIRSRRFSAANPPFGPTALHTHQQLLSTVQVTPGTPASYIIGRSQTHNAFGEVASETDGRTNTARYYYDQLGRLIRKESPMTSATLDNGLVVRAQPIERYYYDINGQTIGMDDANGNRTTQLYDAAGHLLNDYHADLGVKKRGYDIFGNLRYIDNELTRRTRNTYDRKNRLVTVDRPVDGSFVGVVQRIETYDYDEGDQRRSHTNLNGFRERTYYDGIGRVTRTLSADNIDTHYDYATAADGSTTVTMTDGNGRTLMDNRDYFGRIIYHQDLGKRTFRYFYNEAGWLVYQVGNTDPGVAELAAPVDLHGANYDPRAFANDASYRTANPGIDQYIKFDYYRNGYVKEVQDLGINTLSHYEYDDSGNRIFEGYAYVDPNSTNIYYYQWSRAQYDELNRITSITDPKYNVSYEYDLNGNRRHVLAHYHDGVNDNLQEQNYWYAYDNMNRFVVTKGALQGTRGSGTIIAGTTGITLGYDTANNRRSANNESYEYNVDNLLTVTKINNVPRAQRSYDAVGNVVDYVEFGTNGVTPTWTDHYTYTHDGRVDTETPKDQVGATVYTYDLSGNLATIVTPQGATTLTTSYSYSYWDSAKQAQIQVQASNEAAPGWKPGFSSFIYDTNGHLTQLTDVVANRQLKYRLESHGLIMQRDEFNSQYARLRTQWYHYFNGIGVGDAGMVGASRTDYVTLLATRGAKPVYASTPISSADFDYNYQPINDRYPATTPGSYTVRAGDTLQSVAMAVWGDSSLWYLIADANALADNVLLAAGQSLVIPNVVANIHNSASTIKPYNPGELIGDTSPTLPDPPPPPLPKSNACKEIIVIIVAVVVTYITDGILSEYIWGWAAAALGAVAGSIASQEVAIHLGIQEKMDWGAVGVAALTAGITQGIGSTGSVIGDAVVRNVVGQGVNIIAGRQEHFSWSSLAVAAISAPINSEIDQSAAGVTNSTSTVGATWEGFGTDLGAGLAKGVVSQGVSLLVNRGGTIQWANIAGEALGGALGNALGAEAFQSSRIAKRDAQVADFGRKGYGYDINPNGSVSRNYNDYKSVSLVNTGNNGGGGGRVESDPIDAVQMVGRPDSRTIGKDGNSLYAIARNELGAGASEADVVNYTKQLMAANPNLGDPRTLQAGTSVNLPDANTNVSPAAEAAYNKSDAEYQTYRAEQAAAQMAAEAQGSSLGMMARQQQGLGLGLYGVAPGDDYFGFGGPAPSGSVTPSGGGDGIKDWGDAATAVKTGVKLGNSIYAQSEGFDVKRILDGDGIPTGRVSVYGSQAANEALDLPKNFRTSADENARLLAAKGFDPRVGAAIIDDFRPTKLGGALTLFGAGLDVAESTVKYQQGAISESQYAGELGNTVVKTVTTTVVTAGALAGGVALAGVSIAAAPVVITVGAAMLVGYGVNYAYDRVASESMKSGFSQAYNWFR